MAIRTIREEGDEILKKVSRKVEVIDEKIQTLIDDMLETMHKFNGVGLAAVQVGIFLLLVYIVFQMQKEQGVISSLCPKLFLCVNEFFIYNLPCTSQYVVHLSCPF